MFYWDQPFLVGWVGWLFSCSIGGGGGGGKSVFGWFGWSTFSTSSELGWNSWKRWRHHDLHVITRKLSATNVFRVAGVLSVSRNKDDDIPVHRPIHNVVEPTSNSSWRTTDATSCASAVLPSLAEKVESGNDYAQSRPRVNQEQLTKCSFGNLNRFNQNRFLLKRLIPIEHDLRNTFCVAFFSL